MRREFILIMFLISFLPFGLLSCGGDAGKSSKTTISILPDRPIVITASLKDPPVAAPWFRFQVKVQNDSDEPLTIISLQIRVRAYINGTLQEVTGAFDPSSFKPPSSSAAVCTYTSFGIIPAGGSLTLTPKLFNGTTSADCNSLGAVFYAQSNPKDSSDPNGPPPRYVVTVEPLGWFGDESNPTDRYTKSFQFSTQ